MKPSIFLTALFSVVLQSLFAQSPGGVSGLQIWSRDTASVSLPSASGLTYIGVSRVFDDKEQTIWSLGSEKSTALVQTTARAADLHRGTFLNYTPDSLPALRLYSYTGSSQFSTPRQLHVGPSNFSKLPAKSSAGNLVEYAVYPRRLSDRERRRVESYFALKYGISLRGNYLDSRGTTIWNSVENKRYGHRIAGLISDTLSGLYLTRARSAEDGHFLTLGIDAKLSDKQHLLWGDDNGKLAFATSKTYGKWLGRKWLFSTKQAERFSVDITADISQLRQIQPLAAGESYYLAIDSTGLGTFSVPSVQYHKALLHGDSLVFKRIRLGDRHHLTLRAARDMFTTISVGQPDSTSDHTGHLTVRVTGGFPPFRMQLSRERTSVCDRIHSDTLHTLDRLFEGDYLLTTTDRAGHESTHEFRISATGMPEIPSDELPSESDTFFARVSAAPNPTSTGHVRVQVELPVAAPLELTLYTLDGARISSLSMKSDSYFTTGIHLPAVGVYLLTLRSGTHEKTVKLMRI